MGSVLFVSGPAAALHLEQTLHPRVQHAHLLPHLLPALNNRSRSEGAQRSLCTIKQSIMMACFIKFDVFPVALSPGDQLLHSEKKSKAEAEGDEVDSPHAKREIKWDF